MFHRIYSVLVMLYVRVIGFVTCKNDNIWIFGGRNGDSFGENSKYFYRYIIQNHKEIRAIWVTNNQDTVDEVISVGGESYKIGSNQSLKLIKKAKVYLFSTWLDKDIQYYDDRNTLFVNLWHGMPIKKIVYDDLSARNESMLGSIHNFFKYKVLKYKDVKDLGDIICATSEFTQRFLESAFRSKKVLITGQARTDIIYNSLNDTNRKLLIKKDRKQKLILYMPTHRQHGNKTTKNILENKEILNYINEICIQNNGIFAIKYHPNEINNSNIYLENIINISSYSIDVQELLIEADILITDYSSCFIDYMIQKKPIIFYPYDYEDYIKNDMGLYINYNIEVPGPIAKEEKDLVIQIEKYLVDETEYERGYADYITLYYKYVDNRSCDRIYHEIMNKLKL